MPRLCYICGRVLCIKTFRSHNLQIVMFSDLPLSAIEGMALQGYSKTATELYSSYLKSVNYIKILYVIFIPIYMVGDGICTW